MNSLKKEIKFSWGQIMKNPFMLAPMTNQQSYEDGRLSEDELNWLCQRAKGGFALTMTCASHVQAKGKGFPGQLGIFSENQKEGHQRLTKEIKSENSLALIQLHHAGMRSPKKLIEGSPMCPSDQEKYEAKAMTIEEIHQLRDDFILAAERAQKWGYDGVEVHGAHGYILTQFLSSKINAREDDYGGSLKNRARLIYEILEGIRAKCGSQFLLGLRLSPERFGMKVEEIKKVCKHIIEAELVDFIDLSLWDWKKEAEELEWKGRPLLALFTDLDFKNVKLTIAGKIGSARDVKEILNSNVDFVAIGKAAILHYDFANRAMEDPTFKAIQTPVTSAYLRSQALGEKFIDYMKGWPGFVQD